MRKVFQICPVGLWIVIGLMIGRPIESPACGPDFPNWLLDEGDKDALREPLAYFDKELRRMRLGATPHVARISEDPARDTVDVDVEELRRALETTGVAADKAEALASRYRAERWKGRGLGNGLPVTGADELAEMNTPVEVPAGLPLEFAAYFRGAIAWHATNRVAARSEWLGLLQRPAAERHYRSTWAAFMLGKSWEEEDPSQAIAWYRRVRHLVQSGFADSLGLAAASLGWEARLEFQLKHHVTAIELYLQQDAAGDPTAGISLRFVAADALGLGRKALDPLARNSRARRIITAYVTAGAYRMGDIDVDSWIKETGLLIWSRTSARFTVVPAPNTGWHTLRAPAMLWLEAVEAAKVKDVELAEQLALAAYQAGDMDAARRWLSRASSTLATQWLQAKLALRDGKVEEATALLEKVARAYPPNAAVGTKAHTNGLADSLYVESAGEYQPSERAAVGQAVRGELAVADLAAQRYEKSLDSLMRSSPAFWMDAAYVAERVLTLDELKSYVDRNHHAVAAVTNEEADAEGGKWPPRDYSGREGLRYLLARRLARAWRFTEAGPYFPATWQPRFEELHAAWQAAEDPANTDLKRGQALLQAAVITRKHGLELIGTEVEPDWRIHQGNFQEGVSGAGRAFLQKSNHLAASSEELERAARHRVMPETRWHYRTVAAFIGWEAAKLLRNGRPQADDPTNYARLLFEAGSTLNELGICCVPLEHPMGPAATGAGPGTTNTLAGAVQATLRALSAQNDAKNPSPISVTNLTPAILWDGGYAASALAWEAASLLPNNSDETARILCLGGWWIRSDPLVADIFYKALVRRCRKTVLGAEADRLRWFPRIDAKGNLLPREQRMPDPGHQRN